MLFLSVYPPTPFLHTYLSPPRHSLFPSLFHRFAVIDSLKRKSKMASSWNGRVDDFGNTPHRVLTCAHTHTPTTCRSCQSFSGWIILYFLPYGGNDHMSSCGYTRGCVRLRAYVRSSPPCDVLCPSVCMCPLKQGERLPVGFGGRIVNCGHTSETYSHPGGLGHSVSDWPFQNKISTIKKKCIPLRQELSY